MKIYHKILILSSILMASACNSSKTATTDSSTANNTPPEDYDFVVSFGSCNKQNNPQPLWKAMALQNPDIFVWGGDNIYADTKDMAKMAADYNKQTNNPNYKAFVESIDNQVYGIWDDHDYGVNDGGAEWKFKAESQQLFLDFFGVEANDARRQRQGIYHAETFNLGSKSLKLILLDTRYFRSPLQQDTETKKRFKPWQNGEGTLLGKAQWQWLETELKDSNADYHIIVSSIQIWADEHGFETWGNFPHEVDKLKNLLNEHQPGNVVLLSGDRHISEFSSQQLDSFDYPIFDFTSSGLTHAYSKFTSEPNADRVGEVVAKESYGLLKYDFKNNSVLMQMRNAEGVLQEYSLKF